MRRVHLINFVRTMASFAFSWLGFRSGLQVPIIVAGIILLANAAFGLYAIPRESP